jgi:hypothetical protein
LLFYAFAIPTRVLGAEGLAVGAALLNAAALLGIALVTARRAGSLAAAAAVAVATALCWSMGSDLLFDPWAPNSVLLTFLFLLVLVWATSSGDLILLPLVAAVASLLVGTNLEYAVMVPALGVWTVGGLVLELRRSRRAQLEQWPALRRRAMRTGAVTALVIVACWLPSLVEEFTSSSEGNLSRILGNVNSIHTTLGLRDALHLVAGVTVVPPWWLRPSMTKLYSSLPHLHVVIPWVITFVAALVLCAWDGWRRRDHVVTAAVATVAVAVLAGIITMVKAPVDASGGPVGYQTRVLWPVAAFVFLALSVTALRHVRGSRLSAAVGAALLAATATAAWFNVPAATAGTHAQDWAFPVARDINRQIDVLEHRGTLYFDWYDDSFEYQFFASGILAELRRRNVPFVVRAAFLVRQLGDHRRFTGRNADAVVTLKTGAERIRLVPPGAQTVAVHEGLRAAQRRELAALKDQIAQYIRARQLRLNARGEKVLRAFGGANSSGATENTPDPDKVLASRGLLTLFESQLLVLDNEWFGRFARYDALQRRSDAATVAVFVAPIPRRQA